jgi:tRNA(Ile)-lysidine synthase
MAFHPFENKVWTQIKREGFPSGRALVCCSAGVDSIVLLHLLTRLRPLTSMDLAVAHIHHGLTSNRDHRDQALEFVRGKAAAYGLEFFSSCAGERALRSEEECRNWRYEQLHRLRVHAAADVLALAHHADDLLETQLIRLIRGTGLSGFPAMTSKTENLWRPLLQAFRVEIADYAADQGLTYLEDPTNQDPSSLRNWIRRDWLPQLEARQPGACATMARSMRHLSEGLVEAAGLGSPAGGVNAKLPRGSFMAQSRARRRQKIAEYLHQLQPRSFTHGQIEEVLKHLDNCQNDLTFKVGIFLWHTNAEQIWAEPRLKNGLKVRGSIESDGPS